MHYSLQHDYRQIREVTLMIKEMMGSIMRSKDNCKFVFGKRLIVLPVLKLRSEFEILRRPRVELKLIGIQVQNNSSAPNRIHVIIAESFTYS